MNILLLAGLMLAPVAAPSSAARHYRQGVHCMDVIEQPQCAIEHFEALLDENTSERELLTDGLLRLIALYRHNDRDEDIGPLLRRFWQVGGDRRSWGHVPYSARYVPNDLDIMINIDPPRVLEASILDRLGDPMREILVTCDPIHRNDMIIAMRWNYATQQAAREGRAPENVFYERLDERNAKRTRSSASYRDSARRQKQDQDHEATSPLVFELACPLVEALGLHDNRDWRRLTGLSNHRDPSRMVALFELDDLEPRLATALAEGRLEPDGPGRWRLPSFEYPYPLRLSVLDRGELVVAPIELLDRIEASHRARKRQMNRELDRLVSQVPRDTGMFTVLTQDALNDLVFGNVERKSMRRALESILPRPQGLQIAIVVGSSLAWFTRAPSDRAVRGRMFINLVNLIVANSAQNDETMERVLENLDIAESADKRALVASYIVTAAMLERFVQRWL